MAITNPIITEEGLRDFIKKYYTNAVTVALLVYDSKGELTPQSTFSSVVGLEMQAQGGYTRKILNIGNPTTINENNKVKAFAESSPVFFTSNKNEYIPLFTHIAIATDTSTTPSDTNGTLIRIEPVNDTGIKLRDGESYKYKFEVKYSVSFY